MAKSGRRKKTVITVVVDFCPPVSRRSTIYIYGTNTSMAMALQNADNNKIKMDNIGLFGFV